MNAKHICSVAAKSILGTTLGFWGWHLGSNDVIAAGETLNNDLHQALRRWRCNKLSKEGAVICERYIQDIKSYRRVLCHKGYSWKQRIRRMKHYATRRTEEFFRELNAQILLEARRR